MKFVFITGGVLSSLGKGILSSSIAKLLKQSGVNASILKIDVYLNSDAGTLNPFEHGEVFVTKDGFECDLDVGNYERFLNLYATNEQNFMMGSVYKSVLDKERKGDYLGKTIQLIPHVTEAVKKKIRNSAKKLGCDVLVVEVGGTVGDIESELVLEAIRQMKFEDECLFIHLALVPTILTGEQKTKPMQQSVKLLLSRGIVPDAIVARSETPLNADSRKKIALFCNVKQENVFYSPTVESVYELPSVLKKQGFVASIQKLLSLPEHEPDLSEWDSLLNKMKKTTIKKRIGVVGKYATTKDTYMSVFEALNHACVNNNVKGELVLIDSEEIESGKQSLEGFDALVVPGGFGERGIEGIIKAISYSRENNIPFLGLCYGLQLAVIEFSRNVLKLEDANTTEINPDTKNPVICLLPEQKNVEDKGGTMRLGVKSVKVLQGTKAFEAYESELIEKRFRHRFEVNPEYVDQLEKAGFVFSGRDPNREIQKIGELKKHKFFVGVQYHPEFDSRLEKPEELFNALIKATLTNSA
ncbi:CTP synthase [Candidatus Micrarchaeota archaeon]|nr:CTP synthase [Candidatus Micrarchaeota archaeon]